ncbi:MAG: D-2-hydroxyacid dehydrogenase [Flavobacteriales bacterium]|nr:D-2-hydroxyacid dehydrogenase [Flavobacteriales bacterium]
MNWIIRANDGIDESGKEILEKAGCTVYTDHLDANALLEAADSYHALLVRSATKVRQDLIDASVNLIVIGRGGVGLDNIDVHYASEKGVPVVNTPAASSASVAELVFGHLFTMVRGLQITNRIMPDQGDSRFKELKNLCSDGIELNGKTLGIIGAGRIGRETARIAIGCGMHVLFHDPFLDEVTVPVHFHRALGIQDLELRLPTLSKEDVLRQSDFITLHVPGGGDAVIGEVEFQLMKDGSGIVNCARGGVVDEKALNRAIESGKIAYAGIDVFEKEPPVYLDILKHDQVSLSPHIGAATREAQERVGVELAEKVLAELRKAQVS